MNKDLITMYCAYDGNLLYQERIIYLPLKWYQRIFFRGMITRLVTKCSFKHYVTIDHYRYRNNDRTVFKCRLIR